MTKKESEKDSDRPHYYSQFWLDVAAGRRVIGTPKTNEDADMIEPEEPEPVAVSRRSGRTSSAAVSDGYKETLTSPEVQPFFESEAEEFIEPEFEDEMDDN